MGRFTRDELEAARDVRLPDLLADGLAVLFVGINPGLASAASRRHFATPGSRLWPALHRSGFTPRRLAPGEERELLGYGLGIASLVARPTARASELTDREFVEGGRRLRRTVRMRRPDWVAFLGVTGFRAAFGVLRADVGPQREAIERSRVWVLPSPSGLNAHYPPEALAQEFRRLREATGLPDRSACA
ncbi:mismatch-specific DNA-glycosylase [Streptomyces sulphureus]|uniref:mismatch-specific DNA-glycosylase n=1 Tax=Streptomyces sulphureus TaxID=47758 RepID=UPI00036DE642|nr:mismatch-specific DNA-glycosylase [Streptomyces sulphureus]